MRADYFLGVVLAESCTNNEVVSVCCVTTGLPETHFLFLYCYFFSDGCVPWQLPLIEYTSSIVYDLSNRCLFDRYISCHYERPFLPVA